MNTTLNDLQAGLERLYANGHPAGLKPPDAATFTRALASGAPLEQAAALVRLDPRLVASLAQAGVSQVPSVLLQLVATLGTTGSRTRTLRAMATYPLVLAASIAFTAAIVFGMMGPAMGLLPLGAPPAGSGPLLAALIASLSLLVGLAITIFLRLPLPPFAWGWQRLEGFAFLDSLRVFVADGAPLPGALRGAAAWCRGASRRSALALASAVEAGRGHAELEPLLDGFEGSLLLSAAAAGTLPQTLETLVEQRRLALERELPAQAMRIHVTALLLAGFSLVVVGSSFLATYYGTLGG